MICTSIEQSKRLLELGLDPKTADMCVCKTAQDTWVLCGYVPSEYDAHTVPAWSLSALLEVIPKELEPDIQRHTSTGEWFTSVMFQEEPYSHLTNDYYNPIDAAYEMVCYLLEQGLIKKGDNDER